ncbi:MAG: hypothetical protein M3R55_03525 [Acidobacteriota bacterium]|nr:hypothetical protein [Acidobacteriota bacterium]
MPLHARVARRGTVFVAEMMEMPVAAQGSTLDETIERLGQALETHFAAEPPEILAGLDRRVVLLYEEEKPE